MANKKKIATSVAAVATAAALVLGGTFAWQSISQTALNEKEAVINPGGRLHDDFNGTNKDVYVENFADDDIFARVRLDEYMEIVMNKGTDAEKTEVVTTGATKDDTYTYITHKFDAENTTDDWWNWTCGGSTVYMPTFNKNKDSLVADINGTFENDYTDYVEYEKEESKEATAIYDSDSNAIDEVGIDFDNLDEYINDGNIKTVTENHIATETGTATLISMSEWLELADNGEETDNYWVYDTDGWVYYSFPIKSGTATGLLLDEISLAQVMDDSYYYAINVVGQFITADDLGKEDNTGFYDTTSGTVPSDNALKLLEKIGVDVGETTADDDTEDDNDDENANVTVTKLENYLSTQPGNMVYSYNYYEDHEPDFSEIMLLVTYDNGNTKQINGTTDGVTLTPNGDALLSGQSSYNTTYTYTATYGGQSCEITIHTRSEGGGGLPSSANFWDI